MDKSSKTFDQPSIGAAARTALGGAQAQFDRVADRLQSDALENQITPANAARVHGRVKIIAKAANGPITSDASGVLEERDTVVVPDVLANAGGVTCSYFEQVQATRTTTGNATTSCESWTPG